MHKSCQDHNTWWKYSHSLNIWQIFWKTIHPSSIFCDIFNPQFLNNRNIKMFKVKLVSHWSTSKTELLKAEDVKSHHCAKFSRICAKFRLLRAKLVKRALFLWFWRNLTIYNNLTCFYSIFSTIFFAHNFNYGNQTAQKNSLLEGRLQNLVHISPLFIYFPSYAPSFYLTTEYNYRISIPCGTCLSNQFRCIYSMQPMLLWMTCP